MQARHPAEAQAASLPALLGNARGALKANILLVLGSIAWWGSHYLLLWNTGVAAADGLVSGYDGRFTLTIAGTVIALAAMAFAAHRAPQLFFASWKPSYPLFALCSLVALGLLLSSVSIPGFVLAGAVGAVLSGIGNSFVLVIYGELHARIDLHILPLAFAVEVVGGIALFALFATLPAAAMLLASAALVLICAGFYFAFSRASHRMEKSARDITADVGLRSLAMLALLTGLGYGLVRTFAFGSPSISVIYEGMASECIGTCCSTPLLVAVFFLQRRLSLFELCLLFVVPLTATGLLLVSLRGGAALVPTIVNQGGFVCFFVLMWYFAIVLSSRDGALHPTFYIAVLFFSSQLGQLIGALVPPAFSNALATSLVYLILMVAMALLYWRSKTPVKANNTSLPCKGKGDAAASALWAERFGLSPREVEIAALLLQRTPYRQISEELYISENTVKTHVRNIYEKTGVSSREELINALAPLAKKG